MKTGTKIRNGIDVTKQHARAVLAHGFFPWRHSPTLPPGQTKQRRAEKKFREEFKTRSVFFPGESVFAGGYLHFFPEKCSAKHFNTLPGDNSPDYQLVKWVVVQCFKALHTHYQSTFAKSKALGSKRGGGGLIDHFPGISAFRLSKVPNQCFVLGKSALAVLSSDPQSTAFLPSPFPFFLLSYYYIYIKKEKSAQKGAF